MLVSVSRGCVSECVERGCREDVLRVCVRRASRWGVFEGVLGYPGSVDNTSLKYIVEH